MKFGILWLAASYASIHAGARPASRARRGAARSGVRGARGARGSDVDRGEFRFATGPSTRGGETRPCPL